MGLVRLLRGNRVRVCSLSTASMSRGRLSGVGGSLPTVVRVKCRGSVSCPRHLSPVEVSCVRHAVPSLASSWESFLNVPHPVSPNHGYKAETGDVSQEDLPQ